MADLPDPSTLTDEELDAILAGEPLEEQPEETPEVTPPAEDEEVEETPEDEAPEADEEPEEEPEVPEDEEEPKPMSRREQLRVNQLLEKMRQPRQEEAPAAKPVADALDYANELDADPEIVKQLEEDRRRTNEAFYQQGLERADTIEWRTMLRIDEPAVMSKYPQLNPQDKEHFHPGLLKYVQDWYLQLSQYDPETKVVRNPGIRFPEVVDSVFELAEEIASTKVVETTKRVAKQAANTGLRPDGSSAKRLNLNKAPEDMTDEELDAYLAKAIPKR